MSFSQPVLKRYKNGNRAIVPGDKASAYEEVSAAISMLGKAMGIEHTIQPAEGKNPHGKMYISAKANGECVKTSAVFQEESTWAATRVLSLTLILTLTLIGGLGRGGDTCIVFKTGGLSAHVYQDDKEIEGELAR